ncbi:hypothetical protein Trydic_g9138 [Trypoxylus dichotomus]
MLILLILNANRLQGKDGTQIPFLVSVCSSGDHICNGVLIHESWVLTAAHCLVLEGELPSIRDRNSLKRTRLVVSVRTPDEDVKRLSQQVFIHRQFKSESRLNDVAMIHTDEPFQLNNGVEIIQIENETVNLHEHELETMSWGGNRSHIFPCMEGNLELLRLPMVEHKLCVELYNKSVYEEYLQPDRVICVGNFGDSFCNGHTGGPIVFEGKLVALVIINGGCKQMLPSVNILVKPYIGWIKSTMISMQHANSLWPSFSSARVVVICSLLTINCIK